MLAAARDGQHVEQLEVVGVHRVHEALGRALGVGELAPLVEPLLGDARHVGDRRDAIGIGEVRVVSLGDELDLVSQVEQAVVHRGGREHEHLRALARLDDVLDEARVAVGLVRVGALVPEVVALVDDEEVEVAPAQVLEVHLAAHAVVARQVGVVEHRVAEAVVGQRVAVVVVLRPHAVGLYDLLWQLESLAQKFGIEGKGGLLKAQEGDSVVFEREDRSGERGERREVLPFAEPIGAQAA